MTQSLAQRLLLVLWPAFLVAAVAEMMFFAVFDPADLHLFGAPLAADRMLVYAVGFFCFWVLTSAAAALAVFMQRSAAEVNRSALGDEPDSLAGGQRRAQAGIATAAKSPDRAGPT